MFYTSGCSDPPARAGESRGPRAACAVGVSRGRLAGKRGRILGGRHGREAEAHAGGHALGRNDRPLQRVSVHSEGWNLRVSGSASGDRGCDLAGRQ